MGKFEKKTNNKKNTRKKPGITKKVCLATAVLAALCVLIWIFVQKKQVSDQAETLSDSVGIVVENSAMLQTQPAEPEIFLDLGQKLYVTDIGKYAGIYMEDGTDELVDNVLMIKLTNRGTKPLEYAEITLSTSSGDAKFSVSTLNPGTTAILLEKNRMPFTEGQEFGDIQADFAAFFEEPMGLREDILKIQQLDGAMNITNISEEDIADPVRIYYKNSADGIYYGGITYRITLENGIKAGELQQIMAEHFYRNGSAVLGVVIEEN